jgi:hypothetical protein
VSKAIDTIAKLERVATDGSNLTPAGTVAYFPATTPPGGWLKANGQLVSRTTYAALFAVIGTTYGAGDGTTTFALPDLRGEFVRVGTMGAALTPGVLWAPLKLNRLRATFTTGVLLCWWAPVRGRPQLLALARRSVPAQRAALKPARATSRCSHV